MIIFNLRFYRALRASLLHEASLAKRGTMARTGQQRKMVAARNNWYC